MSHPPPWGIDKMRRDRDGALVAGYVVEVGEHPRTAGEFGLDVFFEVEAVAFVDGDPQHHHGGEAVPLLYLGFEEPVVVDFRNQGFSLVVGADEFFEKQDAFVSALEVKGVAVGGETMFFDVEAERVLGEIGSKGVILDIVPGMEFVPVLLRAEDYLRVSNINENLLGIGRAVVSGESELVVMVEPTHPEFGAGVGHGFVEIVVAVDGAAGEEPGPHHPREELRVRAVVGPGLGDEGVHPVRGEEPCRVEEEQGVARARGVPDVALGGRRTEAGVA